MTGLKTEAKTDPFNRCYFEDTCAMLDARNASVCGKMTLQR